MQKGKKKVNYRIFFIISYSLIGSGIALSFAIGFTIGVALLGTGLCFMAIGLANRDKWEKREKKRSE